MYWLTYKEVGYHLISKGIEKSYRVWTLHSEDLSNAGVHPPLVANIREKTSVDDGFEMGDIEEETIGDVGIGMGNFVDSSFGLHGDVVTGDGSLGIEFDEPYVPEPDLGKRYYDYKKKSTEKLYPTCEGPETTLSALVELHNVKKEFGWSGTGMTVLLSLLRQWLPKGNTLPKKYPVMKEMLKDLGMKATCIHACENNCILYWKKNKDLIECPEFQAPRFKVKEGSKGKKNSKEPNKALAASSKTVDCLKFVHSLQSCFLLAGDLKVKIGRLGYQVTNQFDSETKQRSLLFQVFIFV
ncbi:hypothetical protein IFM89_024027 [Coptis chinensis]|uniref:Transposase n=1 Tax=Coptis chinensis TaxID=261450 RepID=A0A835LF15_9MAGN|nr:hypothetical protein IFM89_024027 [Coptis chinensis]